MHAVETARKEGAKVGRLERVRLLAAFERLGRHDPDLRLVLAGGAGWRSGAFRRALSASRMRDRVVLAGRLPDADIAVLLRSCAVMAYPSLYEGYGLPVIEAMAAGSPVVTSTVSSLPEAAGGAAVLVDPRDVGSIAAGISAAWCSWISGIAPGWSSSRSIPSGLRPR